MIAHTAARGISDLNLRERTLTPDERFALTAACSALGDGTAFGEQDELVARAAGYRSSDLDDLRADIADFGVGEEDASLALLKEVPSVPDARCAIALLGSFLGPILRYDNEGDYIMEMKKDPRHDGSRPSFANDRAFFPHTDLSYVPDPPNFVAMHSLSVDEAGGGFSVFCEAEQVIARLRPESVEALQKRQFLFPAPAHYRGPGLVRFAVLKRAASGGWSIRFRRDSLHAETRAGIEAVSDLVTAIDESTSEIMLESGTLALINNRALLHGRTAFANPGGPSTKRHLNRIYVGAAA